MHLAERIFGLSAIRSSGACQFTQIRYLSSSGKHSTYSSQPSFSPTSCCQGSVACFSAACAVVIVGAHYSGFDCLLRCLERINRLSSACVRPQPIKEADAHRATSPASLHFDRPSFTMSILEFRDALSFPDNINSTDTVFFGVHFNLTTLNHWNYTFYPGNNTISNGSWCMLMDPPFTPAGIMNNGSFVNSTWCYLATLPSGPRGHTGIGFAVGFALSLIFVLVNLTRHGKLYLPVEKRFVPVGRRWQWYWSILVCALAVISLFTGIDVERYRVLELPIVLNVFFWFLMQLATMGLVWEGVRHWGSWMERQYIDPQPFVLKQFDRRAMFEFWLPMVFYLFWWLNFFLIVPRNWGLIEKQRSPEQTVTIAIPAATNGRFKAAPFLLFVGWLIMLTSIWHSIRHYEPRNRGWFNRLIGFLGYMPFRFVLQIPLVLAMIGYQELSAWDFSVSPLNAKTNLLAMYLGGYAPSLLIVIIQIADGFLRPNEDKELIRQRRERGAQIDSDLGLVKKPAWWRRVNREHEVGNMRDRIMRNVAEVGGGRVTGTQVERMAARRAADAEAAERQTNNTSYEMNEIRRTGSVASSRRSGAAPPPYYEQYAGRSDQRRHEHTVQMASGLLFPNASPDAGASDRGRVLEVPNQPAQRPITAERSTSTNSGVSMTAPPPQVKSMLDV
ncbi:hypothetical protein F5Y15DRAFT_366649 [Xylariaceae sp. FL0016]|nr:hypothetical protein F5Y15DRAFT_366649 [Xylariaceae sp. FL0016]